MQKFCENCGAELKENSEVCLECGKYVSKKGNNGNTKNYDENNKLALAGFIVSMVSLLINFAGIVGLVGAILSGIGLIQVSKGNGKGKGLAIAGLIVGIFSILYGIYSIINLADTLSELAIFF